MIENNNGFNEAKLSDFNNQIDNNILLNSKYAYSECQIDILFLILLYIKKTKTTYQFDTNYHVSITGRKWSYEQLREATGTLGSRMFKIETEETYTQLRLFSSVDYIESTSNFEVTLNEAALPYFIDLKKNFSVLHLKALLSLSSKFAKRIYSICYQYKSIQSKRIPLLELKKNLALIDKKGNEQFVRISDFKRYVLDVAKKQINESTNITFDYKLIKEGRPYKYIDFMFTIDESPNKIIDFEKAIPKT